MNLRAFYYLFFLFVLCFQYRLKAEDFNNLLAIVIMVKNEADVIVPTLQPFIDAGIDSFLVFDTGSTDRTQEIIKDHFKKCGIKNAYIIEEPFVDFSTSRNRALDLAEQLFSQTTFFLMPDAEWYMHNVEMLIQFCKKNKNYVALESSGGCYCIRWVICDDGLDHYIPRLIRRGKNVSFTGVVHEALDQLPSGTVPTSVYFTYKPTRTGHDKSKARWSRDYELLIKEHEKNPDDERTVFYLAQTCQFLDKWEEAIFYYQKRATMGVISEEKYLALYRIACAIEHIMGECTNESLKHHQWQNALYYYLEAHEMLPHRAEPLVRIASYYLWNKQYALAYLFASRATQLPYPVDDKLFVEKNLYDYVVYDILGQCALYVEEFEVGKEAVLTALKIAPQESHLHHNLDAYTRVGKKANTGFVASLFVFIQNIAQWIFTSFFLVLSFFS